MNRDDYAYETIARIEALARRQERFVQPRDIVSRLGTFFGQKVQTATFPIDRSGAQGSFSITQGVRTRGYHPFYQLTLRLNDRIQWILNVDKKIEEDSPLQWDLTISSNSPYNPSSKEIHLNGGEKFYDVMLRIEAQEILNKVIKYMDPNEPLVVSQQNIQKEMIQTLERLITNKNYNIENTDINLGGYRKNIGGKLKYRGEIDIGWSKVHRMSENVDTYNICAAKDAMMLWSIQYSSHTNELTMNLYKEGKAVAVPKEQIDELFVKLHGVEVLQALNTHSLQKVANKKTDLEEAFEYVADVLNV